MGIVAGGALLLGAFETRKARKSQEKSSRKAERQADIRATRERRETIRKARVRRADILSESALTGASGSSSEAGAISGLQSQVGENLGASFQLQQLSQEQSGLNRQAGKSLANASLFNTVGSFATGFVKPKG